MAEFRLIPSIEQLRGRPEVRELEARHGTDATVDALRTGAAAVREALTARDASLSTSAAVAARIMTVAVSRLRERFTPSLQPAINATGVIIHTNLGRAPLAAAALERVAAVGAGYSTLEYDLARGARGRRDVHAEPLLRDLTGAESAVIVNNNAAATMLLLAALASGREVIVSRGELVEIGGGFRVPDVMAQSGAVLREVGTTNKTRASDYAAAISDRTALILRVHPSNFRIEGFTERPRLEELIALGRQFNVPVAEDLGSGLLDEIATVGLGEPTVRAAVASGLDACCFSGDKLLGGPQAGIIVGRAPIVEIIRRHPLMRALRADKMTYAALEGTLVEYAAGRAPLTVPVRRMLEMTADEIRVRAQTLADRINSMTGWRAALVEGASAVGGGSAPGVELPTWLVSVVKEGLSADALEEQLRRLTPPVVARIEGDVVVLDPRTVLPSQDELVASLLASI